VPLWAARALASVTRWMKRPPVSRTAIALVGQEVTLVDTKARKQLGYTSHVSREQGLAEIRARQAKP
jgi:hypothetical protein